MEESLALQKHLQRLTRQGFSEQENKRKEISLDLKDEIAQTLLGINVRLLTLKKAAGHNAQSLQKKLASTQRVVDMTVKIVERFAREFGKRSRRTP
jgi:signal transduction histidine kinase